MMIKGTKRRISFFLLFSYFSFVLVFLTVLVLTSSGGGECYTHSHMQSFMKKQRKGVKRNWKEKKGRGNRKVKWEREGKEEKFGRMVRRTQYFLFVLLYSYWKCNYVGRSLGWSEGRSYFPKKAGSDTSVHVSEQL